MTRRTIAASVAAALTAACLAAGTASAEPPRPGCGYGDTNHSHQAAPGLDPLDLRPGLGKGDPNRDHTTAPGRAPEDGGDQSNPRRGCKA
ncbi:hypothetical protein [Ilumatobacter sp.]|uniref:hypothetical protein n=1 Tax=Ilumatobacter sp. TaxID=1967498 RepID=UPI003B51D3F3